MVFKKIGGIKICAFILLFCYFLSLSNFSSASESEYPAWKVKLSYTLIARGRAIEAIDPELAKQYYIKAGEIYPLNPDLKKLILAKLNKNNLKTAPVKPVKIALKQKQLSHPVVVRAKRPPKAVKEKGPLSQTTIKKDKDTIIAKFQQIEAVDVYSAEEKGPTVNTILDPYYEKHKNFKIPYFKDREGLKLHPWIGVRGEYMYDEQRVGIESLTLEAQEFNQRRNDEVRDYISINKKQYYREEVILHIRENLPKFTFINHKETVKRNYQAKRLWSSNDVYYDNYDKQYYQIDYTIPRLKKIGFLKLKLRYGQVTNWRTNDNAAYIPYDAYLVGFETAPYNTFINGRVKIKFEYEYSDGEYKRAQENSWDERRSNIRDYSLELDFYNPRKYLRFKPHFSYKRELHSPSHNAWWTRKTGLKIEKEINGKLKYTTDWTYINYTRNKDPYNLVGSAFPPNHLSCSSYTWDNEMEYEIIRDLKFTFGLDYGKGLGLDAFDNITGRVELMLRKPGLIDLRFGYRYTDYVNVNDNIDTVYFKFGWFI